MEVGPLYRVRLFCCQDLVPLFPFFRSPYPVQSFSSAISPAIMNAAAACPFRGKKAEQNADPPQQPPTSSNAAPTCPLGYSSSSGAPKLSTLHCVLCKTYLFDCVSATPCGHLFCRFCAAGMRDCPHCGADILGLEPSQAASDTQGVERGLPLSSGSPHAQAAPPPSLLTLPPPAHPSSGLVDMFLEAHETPSTVGAASQAGAPAPDAVMPDLEGNAGPAAFFLQLGLQAMLGGNLRSAYDRCACRQVCVCGGGRACACSHLCTCVEGMHGHCGFAVDCGPLLYTLCCGPQHVVYSRRLWSTTLGAAVISGFAVVPDEVECYALCPAFLQINFPS